MLTAPAAELTGDVRRHVVLTQHLTRPPPKTAQVDWPSLARNVASVNPVAGTGVVEVTVVPSPCWPPGL
jgi:hypothetical protein